MNIYMVYSEGAGCEEGAALVFAHTSKEARKVGWNEVGCLFTGEYIDFASTRLRNHDWLFEEANQEKLVDDIPHAIDNPKCCKGCEMWGGDSRIGEDGLCDECRGGLNDYR